MSTTIENPLTTTTVQQWKRICINEALKLNAYTILIGEETAPLSDAKLLANSYNRCSKMVGYLRSTLDASQTETILSTIGITDLHNCWKALLNVYEPIDSSSLRTSILQEIISLRKLSTESYTEYGSRVITLGTRLANMLPTGATYTEETGFMGTRVVTPATGTVAAVTTRASIKTSFSTFLHGYTATKLVEDLATSMIAIGLEPRDDSMLHHTLNHLKDPSTVDILDHLRKADSLQHNTSLAEGALAAQSPSTSSTKTKGRFNCKIHGADSPHSDDRCWAQHPELRPKDWKPKGKRRETAKVADASALSPTITPAEERAMMASVAHIASPPHIRPSNSKADTSWNTDSGATSHMTPHCEWIRNMVPCKIPVSLANNHIVWATGKGQVLFNPVIYGAQSESVLLDDVLYVPALQNNLFSILHVIKNSKVRVVIEGNNLEFSRGGKTILMATIHSNMGLLDGSTLSNVENAYISQHIDKNLLH